MGKNANFIGQPIFSQLLKYIPRHKINSLSKQVGSDHYVKDFKTYEHLVSMLYSCFHNCRSLREVVTGMMACHQRINHLGLMTHPKRSTLSDANNRRDSAVFEQIYLMLLRRYKGLLSDSCVKGRLDNRLFIADSTTISLFQEVLKNVGTKSMNGRRKGGIKVHTLIRADQDVPCLIRMTSAAASDNPFLKEINLPQGSVLVFDKGYKSHQQYQRLSEDGITWVTRKNTNGAVEVLESKKVDSQQSENGVLSDELILLGNATNKKQIRVQARLIIYHDAVSNKRFEFITNNMKMKASTIAQLYQRRWQIETLFKRLKQNNQLSYFLGDSENAIRIQIWCAMISDLIIKLIQNKVKRPWAFANLSSMLRIHLMTYTSLINFLENPEKLIRDQQPVIQLSIFSSS
ncbi:MAG: IS4 family transposase [Flavobacteriia bacterium]|nr:IS4 family transposase [Flavobacteriia bacterium]